MQRSGLLEWLNKLFSSDASLIRLVISLRNELAPLKVKMGRSNLVMCSFAFRNLFDRVYDATKASIDF